MALYLVRHGKAGSRSHDAPDEQRPLTDGGWKQAARIGELLEPAGIQRILTSRYTRCVETVMPLAERTGVGIELHESLSEEADIEHAWKLLEELSGTNAVLCSHGNILSPLLDRVHRRGADVEAQEWSCHKGSVWRLEGEPDRPFAKAVQDLLQA
jgi:phosphohistidine phosphatase SixA